MSLEPAVTLINGRPGDSVSVQERALHYGDGLFETISCPDGAPRWWTLHLQRLTRGCERLRIPLPDVATLGAEVAALAAGPDHCVVKIILSRGVAARRGYAPSGTEQPTRIVSRHPWPASAAAGDRPLRIGISEVRIGGNPLLAGLKHLNRLEQVLAQLTRPAGADEVLMLTADEQLVGGSMSNVFLSDGRSLFTPPVTGYGIAGVMRRVLLETAAAAGAPRVEVRPVARSELLAVREIFLTNVCWELRTVGWLDGRPLDSDDWAQRLRRLVVAARN